MPDDPVTLEDCPDLDTLPPDAHALFSPQNPFSSLAWYQATVAHALPAGASAAFLVAREAGSVFAVLPMQRGPGKPLGSLASPYTSLWEPLVAEAGPATLRRLGRALGAFWRAGPVVRLDALDTASPVLAALSAGLREGGLYPLRFDHFGNWHEALPGAWPDYLAARPAKLRETIRRRGKRLFGDLGARTTLTDGSENLDRAVADYAAIYAASWKAPEPFAGFIPAFMREAAAVATLRLFFLHLGDTPIAAQFWIVQGGTGHLVKLAHAEAHRALSPGTVLMAEAIRHLMQHDRIVHLDLGRGDDPYKSLWASERRQRGGLLLADPGTLAGAAAVARQAAGKLRRGLARALLSGGRR